MPSSAEAAAMSSSAPLPNTVNYTIKPVTSESDIPVLAQLSCLALKEDSLHVFAERYSPQGMYQDTVQKLTATLQGPRDSHFLFKAVLETKTDGTTEDPDAEETIVGFSQWKLGYAEMPKISCSNVGNKTDSPETSEPSVLGVAVADSAGQGDAVGNHTTVPVSDAANPHKPLDPWAESARRLFSSYFRHIGDQRHLCKSEREIVGILDPSWTLRTDYVLTPSRSASFDCPSILSTSRHRAETP